MTLIAAAHSAPLSTVSLSQCLVSQRHEVAGMASLEVHKTPCLSLILSPVPSGSLCISRVVT